MDVLKSHAEATSSLLQQLEQQETAQKLEHEAVELVRRALSSYEQTLDEVGQTMQRGLNNVENALTNLQTTAKKTTGKKTTGT